MHSIKMILHPTDFSAPAVAAFRCACSLASHYGAQLVIVHVTRASVTYGAGLCFPKAEERQKNLAEELFDLAVPDEHVDVVRRLEQGKPAAEILHLARLCQADLIVMGTHGRRGLKRFLMGSVADEVIRTAACPVLTVRALASEEEFDLSDNATTSFALKPTAAEA